MAKSDCTIDWDDEVDNLLVAELVGDPDWGEYHELHDKVMQAVKDADKPLVNLAMIFNASTPKGSPFSHYQRSARVWEAIPHAGTYIIVLPNRVSATLVQTMVNVLKRISVTDFDYPIVKTLEEAREIARGRSTHKKDVDRKN